MGERSIHYSSQTLTIYLHGTTNTQHYACICKQYLGRRITSRRKAHLLKCQRHRRYLNRFRVHRPRIDPANIVRDTHLCITKTVRCKPMLNSMLQLTLRINSHRKMESDVTHIYLPQGRI